VGGGRQRTLASSGNSDSSTVFLSSLRGMRPCSSKVANLITRMGARGSIDPTRDFSTFITCRPTEYMHSSDHISQFEDVCAPWF